MQQLVYFDISGLIIIIGVLLSFYIRRNIPCNKNVVYKVVIWIVFSSTVLDIIGNTMQNQGIYIKGLTEVLWCVYYIVHTSIPCMFYLYCISCVSNCRSLRLVRMIQFLMPQCIFILLVITTHATGLIYSFDEHGRRTLGNLHFLCYVLAAYYIFVMLGFIWRYRSQYSTIDRILLSSYSIISIIPIGIQCFFPWLVLENFCATLCCLVILVTVESNDMIVESNTMLFNEIALHDTIVSLLNTDTSFDLIIVKLTELDIIFERMGTQTVLALSRMVATFLKGLAQIQNVYYLNHDCFALVVGGGAESYISSIEERMASPWYISNMELQISSCCCTLHVPEDVDDLERICEYITYMETLSGFIQPSLTAEDINLSNRNRKIQVEDAIHYGLKNHSFKVYYQPIYSFEKNRITAAEALLRLIDPVIGFIPPDEFIPVAESNGAIIEIGEFVFEEVCKFISANRIWEYGIEYVEINLSIIQCVQVDLVNRFQEIMNKYNIPSEMICLEITETAEEKTPEILRTNISRFRELGIEFALDDYGTGYSNLYKVITLPFTVIKFDKHMVWTALSNDKAKLALECEINAMKKMNMKIVAEGVENRSQLMELHRMNSDFIQGYYFSKPIPGKEFLEFVKQSGEDILQYVEERVV